MKQKFLTAFFMLFVASSAMAQTELSTGPAPIPVDSFAAKIKRQTKPQIVDTRTAEEFASNHIDGSINIDMKVDGYISNISKLDKTKPVFVYSIQNYRSGILAKQLRENGFQEVYELKSGIPSWIGAGYPYYSAGKDEVTYADYKKIIADNKIVLVDIGTKYCGACLKVSKLVDSLKAQGDDSYKILQVELYNSPHLATDLKEIKSVPTVIIYKDGKAIWRKNGFTFTKQELEAEIAKAKSTASSRSSN